MPFHPCYLQKLSTVLCFSLLVAILCLMPGTSRAIDAVWKHNVFFMPSEADRRFDAFLEVYYEINPTSLQYESKADKLQGRVRADIEISNSAGVVQEDHYILATTPVPKDSMVTLARVMDIRRYLLQPGHYTVAVSFTDLTNSSNRFSQSDTFSITGKTDKLFLSDLQLVDTLLPAAGNSAYNRNGLLHIPLASSFVENRAFLSYYAELYNEAQAAEGEKPFRTRAFVSRKADDPPLPRTVDYDTLAGKQTELLQGKIRIASLTSGNYHVTIVVEGEQQQELARRSLFFQLMNQKPEKLIAEVDTSRKDGPVNWVNLGKTFMAKYTAPQTKAILKMVLPLANATERNRINEFLNNMDEMYAKYFLYNFWLARNPTDPEKEWKNYSERVKETNKLFGSSSPPGYESHRGIIYLKYGKPTERIVVNNEQGALPYELWQYNSIPGAPNAMFLFYRAGIGLNNYELLHSNVTWEKRNMNWKMILYPGGITGSNSRAEQFFGNR
ncbi:MAG: GWxTD domain-containing protein [Sphingobacteriales bacterium]|nr:MAG: GWxTD domain-containing protein [Sphingobacteriales bacterium]